MRQGHSTFGCDNMDIVLLFIIVCTSAVVASSVNANDVDFAIDYLVRYGYVPDDSLRLTDNTTIDMDAYLRTCLLYTSRCV